MSDLFLATKILPNTPSFPPQTSANTTGFYFGSGTNDLQIGPNNDFTLVSGLAETQQDVQKILLTEQGSNILQFPLYGTTLQSLIGNKDNINILSGSIQDQITTALQILYLLTQNRTNTQEVVQTLYSLNISQQDLTNFSVFLTIIAASGQEITTGINISSI